MLESLRNRRVMITGGTRGIGLGIAHVFVQAGANVVVTGRDEAAGHAAVAALEGRGDTTVGFLRADAASASDADDAAAQAVALLGGLDVLVANAGIYPEASLGMMSPADLDEVLATNLAGTIHAVRAAVPALAASSAGRIIVISSITGPLTGIAGLSHYGASKAGQLGFVRSAALELAESGITINAVCPGNIRTEGLEQLGGGYLEGMLAAIPLRRLGEPEDIGHAVAFLASDEASFITGQSLVVDGGQVVPESQSSF